MTNTNEIKITATALLYVEAINKSMGLISQHEEYKYFCNDMGKVGYDAYIVNLSCCISNSASGIKPQNLKKRKKAIEDGIALMELVQGVSELSDGEKDAILRYLPFRSFASKE
jgi:hypothetical protein